MLTADQLLAAHKANVTTLFDLTQKTFEGVEKLVELNLQVAKTAMDEVAQHAAAVLSVKDAQELLALQTSMLQPAAEKAAAYGRHVYDIASTTGAEVSKVAESQLSDAQKKFMAVVDTAVKNAPAGTENAVVLVKSAVAAANNDVLEPLSEGDLLLEDHSLDPRWTVEPQAERGLGVAVGRLPPTGAVDEAEVRVAWLFGAPPFRS